MSFRAIRPGHPEHESSSRPAGNHPQQHEGTGYEGGRAAGGGDGEGSRGGPFKRTRNTPRDVTANACVQCKKARTKCDGRQPCHRCSQRSEGATCEYRVHVKMAKEEIVEKFTQLAEQYRWSHQIMKALISDNHAPDIVDRLKNGEDYGSVARSFQDEELKELDRPSPSQSVASIKGESQPLSPNAMIDEVERIAESVSRLDDGSRYKTETTEPDDDDLVFRWTRATHETKLVNHLVTLYFTWIHPVHMVLSEPHFKASFVNEDSTYCSSALINAICAMACHFLDKSADNGSYPRIQDTEALGERFMAEGRSAIRLEDHNKLTTVQTFAIMFLFDSGTGKALKASSYIRFASSTLLNLSMQGDLHRDAVQITLWGISTLNLYVSFDPFTHLAARPLSRADRSSVWTEFTYQRLEMPRLPNPNILDGVRLDREDARWRFYRDTDDREVPDQPSLALVTASEMAKFMNIVRDTIAMYYADGEADVTARAILTQYWRYLSWREELPSELTGIGDGVPLLPHVFFLQIHYHTAVVNLFRPLVGIDHVPAGSDMDPEAIAHKHAEEGLRFFVRYRQLFGDRYQTQAQLMCLMHLADFIVRFGPPNQAPEAARLCLTSLKEARVGFAVCGPLRAMFCRTLVDCGVLLPPSMADLMISVSDYCLDELMEACTRLSYTQPIEHIRRRIVPTIEEDWYREWQRGLAASSSTTSLSSRAPNDDKLMRIQSILNG
ncbi:MAG: hypothetical protein M1817_006191 [Caeruleum heppii]|nr:MAG: hypothetical protein M1817_006191 [Caeruleum heppii]